MNCFVGSTSSRFGKRAETRRLSYSVRRSSQFPRPTDRSRHRFALQLFEAAAEGSAFKPGGAVVEQAGRPSLRTRKYRRSVSIRLQPILKSSTMIVGRPKPGSSTVREDIPDLSSLPRAGVCVKEIRCNSLSVGSQRKLIKLSVAMARIDIIVNCSDAYAQHVHVMMQSVLQSNRRHVFRFYVLVPQEFSYTLRLLEAERSDHCEVKILKVGPEDLIGLPVGPWSEAAYYRLLVGHLLPKDLKRVLYLDCDLLVCDDLQPLWDTDLNGAVVAAVQDPVADCDIEHKRQLGLQEDATYFNAGVLLIDLSRWRQQEVGREALEFCKRHPVKYYDQDGLNACVAGDFCQLDLRWNAQCWLFERYDYVPSLVKRAVVVHFNGPSKPWQYTCAHPMAYLYLRTLKKTPWRNYVPADRTMRNVAKYHLRWYLRRIYHLIPFFKGARAFVRDVACGALTPTGRQSAS